MARSITRELGGSNITANVVAPGFINTAMTEVLPEETKKNYLASIPAGRFAEAEEVARVIRWLASDEASYISGAVIPVDGVSGMVLTPPRTDCTKRPSVGAPFLDLRT